MTPLMSITLCHCPICHDCPEDGRYNSDLKDYFCEECEKQSHKTLGAVSKFWVKGRVRFSEGKFPGC